MRVWCIEAGEPLPTDNEKGRLWRIGLLLNVLHSRGHDVTWWASTFIHSHKTHRFLKDTLIEYKERYRIILLHGTAYKKNISFQRIINHRTLAKKFSAFARKEPEPDIILCCLPTLEFCAAATKYGMEHNVPVVLDIRDMWPDIMVDIFPDWAKSSARLLLTPLFHSVKKSCSQATAIFGMSPEFQKKGLDHAGRDKTEFDRDFPFGYPENAVDGDALSQAVSFWQQYGISSENKNFIVCFFGALSRRYELQVLIRAANEVKLSGAKLLLVICGKGEMSEQCKEWANGADNIIFPGWIGAPEIKALMQVASVGVIPYPSTQDFRLSIPNKAIEYLAGGLPIVSSIQGVLQELLSVNDCGVTYENQNYHQLASILSELYGDPQRLRELSRNASRLFKEKYTAEKVYSAMSDNLENIAHTYQNGR